MPKLLIDFVWPRDVLGYRCETQDRTLLSGSKSKIPGKMKTIVPIDGELQHGTPLTVGNLFAVFAQLDGSPESCLQFARHHGPLTRAGNTADGELLSTWVDNIKAMREALSLWQKGLDHLKNSDYTGRSFGKILHGLKLASPDEPPRLTLVPTSLLSALWLQFEQEVTSGSDLKSCAFCGRWFTVGPSSARRLDARYCSETCRNRYHNQRHKGRTGTGARHAPRRSPRGKSSAKASRATRTKRS